MGRRGCLDRLSSGRAGRYFRLVTAHARPPMPWCAPAPVLRPRQGCIGCTLARMRRCIAGGPPRPVAASIQSNARRARLATSSRPSPDIHLPLTTPSQPRIIHRLIPLPHLQRPGLELLQALLGSFDVLRHHVTVPPLTAVSHGCYPCQQRRSGLQSRAQRVNPAHHSLPVSSGVRTQSTSRSEQRAANSSRNVLQVAQ